MLYEEFLKGTGAVEGEATWKEYQRVEQIYMQSDHMTKEDAYRMAKVETIKEREKKLALERKTEKAWVLVNIIPAAAYIRGMADKAGQWTNFSYRSLCGNLWELRLEREINCGSVRLYSFWCNGKQIDTRPTTGYGLLPRAEFQSSRAGWHDKTQKELEDLFGFIA
jgi:hypothetical protein